MAVSTALSAGALSLGNWGRTTAGAERRPERAGGGALQALQGVRVEEVLAGHTKRGAKRVRGVQGSRHRQGDGRPGPLAVGDVGNVGNVGTPT